LPGARRAQARERALDLGDESCRHAGDDRRADPDPVPREKSPIVHIVTNVLSTALLVRGTLVGTPAEVSAEALRAPVSSSN
jgi:hypothetical protein